MDNAARKSSSKLKPVKIITQAEITSNKFGCGFPDILATCVPDLKFKGKPTKQETGKIQNKFKEFKLKPPYEKRIETKEVTQLLHLLQTGHPLKFYSWLNSEGTIDNTQDYKCNTLFFDYDEGILTEEDYIAFEERASSIYHFFQRSSSWGEPEEKETKNGIVKKKYRYHCFLILDETITDPSLWEDIYRFLMKKHEAQIGFKPDEACADWTRLCYAGKANGVFLNPLPLQSVFSVLSNLPKQEEEKSNTRKKNNNDDNVVPLHSQVDYELLKEVCHDLVRLDAHRGNHDEWLFNLIFPLMDYHKRGFITLHQLKELYQILDDGTEGWKDKLERELKKEPSEKHRKIASFILYCDNYGLGEKAKRAIGGEDEDEEIPPVTYKQVQDFPMEVFPKEIREYGEAVADSLKAPVDFFATAVIGAASVLIGHQYQFWAKRDSGVYGSVWINAVAKSGSAKSPAQRAGLEPVYERQKIYKEIYEQEVQEQILAQENEGDAKDIPKPFLQQILASNATIEALKDLLERRSIMLYVDEAAGWIKSMGQYKKGSSGEMEDFLTIADNGLLVINRKGIVQQIDVPYMTFLGGMQPSKLEQLISMGLITNDGFLERFLPCFPNEMPAEYNPDGADPELKETYIKFMTKLHDCNKTGYTKSVGLNREAKILFDSYMKKNHAEINNPDFDERLESYWRKTLKNFSRLVLIIHIIHVISGNAEETKVNVRIVELGIKLMDYFKSHFAKMIRFSLGSVQEKKYEKICGYIMKRNGRITVKELQQARTFGKAQDCRSLLQELEIAGLGRFLDNHKKKPMEFELFIDN